MAADDKVLLITGASSGIGAQTARRAAEAGYRLVLAARSEDKLSSLAEELGGDERALAVACDVAEWADQERLAAAALDGFGRIDAVFANAGIGATRGFLEESPEHWREMVLTNVLGAALTIRATLPALLEAGTGHFLITGSVAGRRALPGSLYSSTKWAVTGMAESLRQELRQMQENTKIRVTLIEPGMTDTDFFDNRPGPDRALSDDDIARAVLYALDQPEGVDVNEILIRPTSQPT
jgi:NADP-dependent 3-hydroxy acid dehydrogenase YdfG